MQATLDILSLLRPSHLLTSFPQPALQAEAEHLVHLHLLGEDVFAGLR